MLYKMGLEGAMVIRHYEKCKLTAYQDSKGVWTIGWGNTYYQNGSRVKEGDTITETGATNLFWDKIEALEKDLNKEFISIKPLTKNQFDALMSFVWNIGIGQFRSSTMLRVLKVNPRNYKEIDHQFLRWVYSGGEKIDGLKYRRMTESLLYCQDEIKFYN